MSNRYDLVTCPVCAGERGHVVTVDGWNWGADCHTTREEWEDCGPCDGTGEVQRVDRLAYLIGQRDALPSALARLAAINKAWAERVAA